MEEEGLDPFAVNRNPQIIKGMGSRCVLMFFFLQLQIFF